MGAYLLVYKELGFGDQVSHGTGVDWIVDWVEQKNG